MTVTVGLSLGTTVLRALDRRHEASAAVRPICSTHLPMTITIKMRHAVTSSLRWNLSADPANTTPNVRPLFKRAAEHVRQSTPPGLTLEQRNALIETLEAPRGQRDERALRLTFRPDAHDGEHTSREMAVLVKERGWQRFVPPAGTPAVKHGTTFAARVFQWL